MFIRSVISVLIWLEALRIISRYFFSFTPQVNRSSIPTARLILVSGLLTSCIRPAVNKGCGIRLIEGGIIVSGGVSVLRFIFDVLVGEHLYLIDLQVAFNNSTKSYMLI
jgi:hypothetical protein